MGLAYLQGFNRKEKKMKTYYMRENIGKCRYVISFHDGVKTHSDNSPFFDVHICSNKRSAQKFKRALKADGYIEK